MTAVSAAADHDSPLFFLGCVPLSLPLFLFLLGRGGARPLPSLLPPSLLSLLNAISLLSSPFLSLPLSLFMQR